jgi:flagellar basal-body rod protein FlgG
MNLEKRLDVIANNLANVNTPGFRRDNVHFSDFIYETTYVDQSQGILQETSNPLDVAINGDGFFRVDSGDGILYTRAGNFRVNNEGLLVTQEGYPVLGRAGEIRLENMSFQIDKDGQIINQEQEEDGQEFDGGTVIDTLDVVNFPPGTLMRKVNNEYFLPPEDQNLPIPAADYTIEQGKVEGANVNVVMEMALMIDTQRAFEAVQKTFKSFGDINQALTTKLTQQ